MRPVHEDKPDSEKNLNPVFNPFTVYDNPKEATIVTQRSGIPKQPNGLSESQKMFQETMHSSGAEELDDSSPFRFFTMAMCTSFGPLGPPGQPGPPGVPGQQGP